jgi:hypothetical protein
MTNGWCRSRSGEESKYPWDYYAILAKIPGNEAFGPPPIQPVRW